MKILATLFVVVLAVAAVLVLAGQFGLLSGQAPVDLGVHGARLKAPANTPNSVSSQADLYPDHAQRSYAQIAPLTYSGAANQAMRALATVVQATPHCKLVAVRPDYLYAQCSTAWLRFTDDVEFWLDSQPGLIQLRSASRIGHGDLGVNRSRIETIRAQFQKNSALVPLRQKEAQLG
jgi:uncharacterized protein (DUF1499 family)